MYYITEKHASVGNVISRDNGRLCIGADGETTPASDEAARFETQAEALAYMRECGLDTSKGGHWTIVRDDDN